jgi:hypothetical protein
LNRPTRDSSDSGDSNGSNRSNCSNRRSLARPAAAAAGIACGLALLALSSVPLHAQESFGPSVVGYGFGQNKIAYRNFDWHIYHSPHFNV